MKSSIVVVVLGCCAGCGTRPATDEMFRCVPAGTTILGAIDLAALRASPLYRKLPPAVVTMADSYNGAERLLCGWNGADILCVIRGNAPGATVIAPGLAVTGSPESIRSAVTQYHSGKTGVPGLVDYAARTVGQNPIWVAAQGGTTLPLTGNLRNLNRLFHGLQYVTLTIGLSSSLDLKINALGQSEEGARDFEENLRGLISLASAAESRRLRIATLLNSVQIRRDGSTARASVSVPAEEIDGLMAPFLR